MVELLFAAPSWTQIHVCTPYIASDVLSLFPSKSTTPSIRAKTTLHDFFKEKETKRAHRQLLSHQSHQAGRQSGQTSGNTTHAPPSSSCHLSVDPPEGWLPWRCRLFLSIIGSATQGRGLGVFLPPPPGVCLRICLCTPFDLDRSGKHERHNFRKNIFQSLCCWLIISPDYD